jgi:hypothetical protein
LAQAETENIDFVVLLKLPARIALERGWNPFPEIEMDPVVNQKVAKVLEEVYHELQDSLPRESLVLDGQKPLKENFEQALEAILSLINNSGPNSRRSPFISVCCQNESYRNQPKIKEVWYGNKFYKNSST